MAGTSPTSSPRGLDGEMEDDAELSTTAGGDSCEGDANNDATVSFLGVVESIQDNGANLGIAPASKRKAKAKAKRKPVKSRGPVTVPVSAPFPSPRGDESAKAKARATRAIENSILTHGGGVPAKAFVRLGGPEQIKSLMKANSARAIAKRGPKSDGVLNATTGAGTKKQGATRTGAVLWKGLQQQVTTNSSAWHNAKMAEWRSNNGVAQKTGVFSIKGGAFRGVEEILKARGWAFNTDNNSLMWDIKFIQSRSHFGRMALLKDTQALNYYNATGALTTKAGLCNSLMNFCYPPEVQLDSFYPRCFDLGKEAQLERFIEDFKLTKCHCILNIFVRGGGHVADGTEDNQRCYPRVVVVTALAVCNRRLQRVDETLDGNIEPAISAKEWACVQPWSLKRPGRRVKLPRSSRGIAAASSSPRAASAPPPRRRTAAPTRGKNGADAESEPEGSDCSSANDSADEGVPKASDGATTPKAAAQSKSRGCVDAQLAAKASKVLEELVRQSPQFALDGVENIWVIKPAALSRGRGIQLSANLDKFISLSSRIQRNVNNYVVQKYIENPLIINRKKFDIRQWVLVTSLDPLAVWFYQDCYVRFSFADYDPRKLKNKFAHLTNNCISKGAEGYAACKEETMWHSNELRNFLRAQDKTAGKHGEMVDPWIEHVQPQMKDIVLRSLEAARENIANQRDNCFELFGYDFMISEDLNVWLLEVNSSPDLSASTSITAGLVKNMLNDLIRVVVDVEGFGNPALKGQRRRRAWADPSAQIPFSGAWELLNPARRQAEEAYRKETFTSGPPSMGLGLCLSVKKINLRRPQKGECPNGTDADVPKKYRALELLCLEDVRRKEREVAQTAVKLQEAAAAVAVEEAAANAASEATKVAEKAAEAAAEERQRFATKRSIRTLSRTRSGTSTFVADAVAAGDDSDGSADSREVQVDTPAAAPTRALAQKPKGTITQRASGLATALKSFVENRMPSRLSVPTAST